MPLYVGDYLADTAHLDAERSGCYLHWLMHYWRKGPLPDDLDKLTSIGRLHSADAPNIVRELLQDFFILSADGFWHQKRADLEKTRWRDKRLIATEKASKASRSRWQQRDASSTAQAMRGACPAPSPSTAHEDANATTLKRSVPPGELAGTLPLVDGTLFEISKAELSTWAQTFPGIHVIGELMRLKVWFDANPRKRKTRNGIKRSIFYWLSRAQDKSQWNGGNNGNRAQQRTTGNVEAARQLILSGNDSETIALSRGSQTGTR